MIDTVKRRSISYPAAARLVEAITSAASAAGHAVSVAVVDEAGGVIALARMDGAFRPTPQMARDKARTACLMQRDTTAFSEHINSRADLRVGFVATEGLTTFPGGLPIIDDGVVIGGLGVSGAPPEDDISLGAQALEMLGAFSESADQETGG